MKKSAFQKAAARYGGLDSKGRLVITDASGRRFELSDDGDGSVVCRWGGLITSMRVSAETSPGDVGEYIYRVTSAESLVGVRPPPHLKGATASGSFEDLINREGARLQKLGILTLGRYPVASVITAASPRPLQVPSLPDYEGVTVFHLKDEDGQAVEVGRQFIFEAKVCSGSHFKVCKSVLKPRQVRHMLLRSDYQVPCHLLIHFNERKMKTLYDPPFTVAIPVKPSRMGGLKIWEEFADSKEGKYTGSIDRAAAAEAGIPVHWHMPSRCKSPRPALRCFIDTDQTGMRGGKATA